MARIRNRRAARTSNSGASWISYSDMMAALLLVFVLILSVSLYQYFTMLETKTAELDAQKALEELEAIQEAQKKAALPAMEFEPMAEEKVDFDTFCKSDFRAVKVKTCEAVKKSEKLLRFTLDDGTGTDRQILSGIHKWYKPEELVGKTLVAIVNLPPRKMMGLESCGMLLSAVHTEKGEEVLNLIMVDDKIPAGAKLC